MPVINSCLVLGYVLTVNDHYISKKRIYSVVSQRVKKKKLKKRAGEGSMEKWVKGKGHKSQAHGIWITNCTGKSNNCQLWNVSA